MVEPFKCVRRLKALTDIDEHASFIAKDSIDSAIRFLEKIDETVELLREFPGSGGKFLSDHQELSDFQVKLVIDFPRYAIFYRATENTIEIVRVLAWGQEVDALLIAN